MSEADKLQEGYDATPNPIETDAPPEYPHTSTADTLAPPGSEESSVASDEVASDEGQARVEGEGSSGNGVETGTVRDIAPESDLHLEDQGSDQNELDASTEPEISVFPDTIQLSAELESLRQQLEERNRQYMRIGADFDNFRKRTEREKTDLEQRVKRDTICELLPVIDNFERARTHIKPQTDQEEGIHKSYQGVYKQLVDCLKRIGVAPMRAQGKPFDPSLHEAVMREPTDQYEEGVVMEELVNGYLLGEQVLRHAMVKVAVPAESESSHPSGNGADTPVD